MKSAMKPFLFAFAIAAPVFLALDAMWLTAMAPRLYRPALGAIMREDFDVAAAAGFYLLYLAGVVTFAVLPSSTSRAAAARGAFFGLVAYATYDLTNQATIRGWPWHVTAADLAWGTFATAVACAIAHRVTSRPSRR